VNLPATQRKLGFLFLPALLTFVKANNFSSLGSKTSFCKLLLKAAIVFLVPKPYMARAERQKLGLKECERTVLFLHQFKKEIMSADNLFRYVDLQENALKISLRLS
jgi:hypothetical protein